MAEETEVPMILDGEPIVTQSDTAIPDSAATDHPNGGEKRGREETGDPEAEGEENGASKKPKVEAAETPAEEQKKAAETSVEEEEIAKVVETRAEEEPIEKAEEMKEGEEELKEMKEGEEELKEMKEGEEELKDGDVSLGPKNFKSGSDMFSYFFKFLHFWVPNLDINEYEHMVLLDLLKKGHAEYEKKIGGGVRAFQVRYHPTFKSRCFFLVRDDGSSDDFSFRKCVHSILPLPENLKLPSASDGKMGGGRGGGGGWRGRGGGRGGRGRGRRGGRN